MTTSALLSRMRLTTVREGDDRVPVMLPTTPEKRADQADAATIFVNGRAGKVLLGLPITGWAMGFMAMLGVLSLGGFVINNAIVRVDFIATHIAGGQDPGSAGAAAGRLRMRPIVLTTLTTVGGMLPLSLFGAALWAPMTNGMIVGLLVSTVLTLFVIASLYVLCAEGLGMETGQPTA